MGSFNKVILMGNLTRDVELKNVGNDQSVAKFGLAVNRRFKDSKGEQKEETTFVDCECWGKTAQTIAKNFTKGKPIHIDGRLKLDQWQDKDGGNRSKLMVVVNDFTFVGNKSGETSSEGGEAVSSDSAEEAMANLPF